ncbi:MAG: ribosome silencing factor [Actinomycetota bacterium]
MSTAAAAALAITAARAADDKKAENTIVLQVGNVLGITEYFVITSASNRRLVRTIVDAVEEQVRAEHGRSPLRSEGVGEQQWVLVDFGDVVVHVFADEVRAYYEIERLYRDVPRLEWQATAPDSA